MHGFTVIIWSRSSVVSHVTDPGGPAPSTLRYTLTDNVKWQSTGWVKTILQQNNNWLKHWCSVLSTVYIFFTVCTDFNICQSRRNTTLCSVIIVANLLNRSHLLLCIESWLIWSQHSNRRSIWWLTSWIFLRHNFCCKASYTRCKPDQGQATLWPSQVKSIQ